MAGNVFLWGKGSYLGLEYDITIPTPLPSFNETLGTNFTRGDIIKIAIGDEIIYLLDSKNSLHSLSRLGHHEISLLDIGADVTVDDVWAYHKTAVVLSSSKLYHVNYHSIISNSPFSSAFESLNSVTHLSIGYHELLVLCNDDELVVIKEEGNVDKIQLKTKINAINSVRSCTIAATILYHN